MRKLLLIGLALVARTGFAGTITNVSCPVISGPGASGCTANAGPFFADITVYPGANNSGSAFASFSGDYDLTVTSGPAQGYFAACFTASGDTYMGSDFASAFFGSQSIPAPLTRAFSISSCGMPALTPFSLDVPVYASVYLSASASTSGATPQANVNVNLTGFEFFDLSQNSVSGVTYSLTEIPTPESGAALDVASGLLLLGFCGRLAIRQ